MLKQHLVIVFFIVVISSSLIQADDENDDIPEAVIECMETNDVKPEDYLKMMEDKPEELPENVLCAMKCIMEALEIIDEEGNINPDNIENCPIASKLPDDEKSQLKECLGQIDKIESCEDVVKTLPCSNAIDGAWTQ